MSATGNVHVAGTGMTRFGKQLDRGLKSLAREAVAAALSDADMTADQVQEVYFANAAAGIVTGQEMIRGQSALRETGVMGVPIVNVENACASGSTAFHLACAAVASERCDIALAVGVEKLTHADRARAFAAIGAAIDLERRVELEQRIYGDDAPTGSGSLFMDVYADLARRYMETSGATDEDFALVAVKSHRHGALNPHAQYRDEVTVAEVLDSRTISTPLTLLMCSPIGDGAAAIVVCSDRVANGHGGLRVQVRATALASGRDDEGPLASERAAARAYAAAGVGPEDLDVVELHDAAAPAELMVYEELGLCAPGEGPALLRSGATTIGGRLPVNPSGGLLAKGHPVGATGCAQLVELADQLRGRAGPRQVDGARVALAENAGGFLGPDQGAAAVTILTAA